MLRSVCMYVCMLCMCECMIRCVRLCGVWCVCIYGMYVCVLGMLSMCDMYVMLSVRVCYARYECMHDKLCRYDMCVCCVCVY